LLHYILKSSNLRPSDFQQGLVQKYYGIKISDNPWIEEDEPVILFNGVHHAEEVLSAEVCQYLLNDLISKYRIDSQLLTEFAFLKSG